MPRYMFRNTLAAVLIGDAAASAATAQDIMVKGHGERVVERTNIGAEVVEHSASAAVDVRDLDLFSPAGWNAMEQRVSSASRDACDGLKERMPIELLPERSDCERKAYRGAIARVRELPKASSD